MTQIPPPLWSLKQEIPPHPPTPVIKTIKNRKCFSKSETYVLQASLQFTKHFRCENFLYVYKTCLPESSQNKRKRQKETVQCKSEWVSFAWLCERVCASTDWWFSRALPPATGEEERAVMTPVAMHHRALHPTDTNMWFLVLPDSYSASFAGSGSSQCGTRGRCCDGPYEIKRLITCCADSELRKVEKHP